MGAYTIGVDFGTNSVRALVADCSNGHELGTAVFNYPAGEDGIILDPNDHNLARQHPGDYIKGLRHAINDALADAGEHEHFTRDEVIAIGVDTTASTPIPVDAHNQPLALHPDWRPHPAAQAWLWKDHTSIEEALAITAAAEQHRPHYLAKCGGTYSSEWFWSKVWHCLKTAPEVFEAAHSWVEMQDLIPAMLCGVKDPAAVKRGVCAAGHKAMYSDEWGGLPDAEFLAMLDPKLAELRGRLYESAIDISTPAGTLSKEWASELGLREGIPVAPGAIDAHLGAVGSGVQPGTMIKIIGTSTCDCTVWPLDKKLADIPGICGIVAGSILPGHYGLEAGQSAVGDIFHWFVDCVCEGDASLHAKLTDEASRLRPGESGLLALDWNNGNRTILVNPLLTGLLLGQTLHTSQAEIYRALIEATAFGARAILERYREYGVETERIICCGGIAEKNPMLMQIYADVTNCAMQVARSEQACALGSAIAAAVCAGTAGGGYDDFASAQAAMTGVKDVQYTPNAQSARTYDDLYGLFRAVHDAFGGLNTRADLSAVMKRLIDIKAAARA